MVFVLFHFIPKNLETKLLYFLSPILSPGSIRISSSFYDLYARAHSITSKLSLKLLHELPMREERDQILFCSWLLLSFRGSTKFRCLIGNSIFLVSSAIVRVLEHATSRTNYKLHKPFTIEATKAALQGFF